MREVILDAISEHLEEAVIQNWFYEEGDAVTEGDDLVEFTTEDGPVMIAAPCTGVLAEVYYDEGETVGRGEVLCVIDDDESDDEDDDK